jgi:hypothetical protein
MVASSPADDERWRKKESKRLAKGGDASVMTAPNGYIDCACVIHGKKYDWYYVENLYNMLRQHSRFDIKLHVFTEPDRSVPPHMIKHALTEWPGISGHKKSWWYKMQMFDPDNFSGRLFYLDLDVVIVRDIDWVWSLDPNYFWTIRDFRYLWRSGHRGINSSMMIWDTRRFQHIWRAFRDRNIAATVKQYHGDQDFLTAFLDPKELRFFNEQLVKSWRWQIKDGGFDMEKRVYLRPDAGSVLDPKVAVMIFHGSPKPHEVTDSVIRALWAAPAQPR